MIRCLLSPLATALFSTAALAQSNPASQRIEMVAENDGFPPAHVAVEAGREVVLVIEKRGLTPHDFRLDDPASGLEIDESLSGATEIRFTPQRPGEFEVWRGKNPPLFRQPPREGHAMGYSRPAPRTEAASFTPSTPAPLTPTKAVDRTFLSRLRCAERPGPGPARTSADSAIDGPGAQQGTAGLPAKAVPPAGPTPNCTALPLRGTSPSPRRPPCPPCPGQAMEAAAPDRACERCPVPAPSPAIGPASAVGPLPAPRPATAWTRGRGRSPCARRPGSSRRPAGPRRPPPGYAGNDGWSSSPWP